MIGRRSGVVGRHGMFARGAKAAAGFAAILAIWSRVESAKSQMSGDMVNPCGDEASCLGARRYSRNSRGRKFPAVVVS
jgi:hypothetical protein